MDSDGVSSCLQVNSRNLQKDSLFDSFCIHKPVIYNETMHFSKLEIYRQNLWNFGKFEGNLSNSREVLVIEFQMNIVFDGARSDN